MEHTIYADEGQYGIIHHVHTWKVQEFTVEHTMYPDEGQPFVLAPLSRSASPSTVSLPGNLEYALQPLEQMCAGDRIQIVVIHGEGRISPATPRNQHNDRPSRRQLQKAAQT